MNAPFDTAAVPGDAPAIRPEVPADVTLSICIPTYNRAPFLEHLFPHLKEASKAFDFSYEIVVSDNCSPDNTPEVVERFRAEGMPIRYYRQEENKLLSNLLSVYHRARGKYLVYLADDDLIIPEALADNIRYMLANPEIRAVYTPWEIYDDLNKVSGGAFYSQEEDLMVFGPGQETDLFTTLVKDHIFPETVIYRADAARAIVSAPRFCYWAFTYLAQTVAEGPVALRNVPFYRSVTLTPVAPNRGQQGVEGAMTSWDDYRGGLEYMIFSLLRRGNLSATPQMTEGVRQLIDHFVATRMRVALRLWLERKDYIRAYELIARLNHLAPSAMADMQGLENLPLLALAQTLARLANGIAEIERLVIAGADDGQALGNLLRDTGLERRILAMPPPKAPSEKNLRTSVVFIARDDLRQEFLDQGYEPGLIISERDIRATILL
ncbi:glycosyltransferase family A protein [Azorhizobium doebereinerae]|uniref:glycosyltransferase family A protein n=1 Tax=Azorhizobium doebereinerae TaxID=281091 RepID=UPI00041DD9EF|nr:glycosyltransferase family A protein [Azorhizobium doebereinerae]